MEEFQRINIYNLEDRLAVANILIKNGYKVWQGKEKKTENGKSVDYFLCIEKPEEPCATTK